MVTKLWSLPHVYFQFIRGVHFPCNMEELKSSSFLSWEGCNRVTANTRNKPWNSMHAALIRGLIQSFLNAAFSDFSGVQSRGQKKKKKKKRRKEKKEIRSPNHAQLLYRLSALSSPSTGSSLCRVQSQPAHPQRK